MFSKISKISWIAEEESKILDIMKHGWWYLYIREQTCDLKGCQWNTFITFDNYPQEAFELKLQILQTTSGKNKHKKDRHTDMVLLPSPLSKPVVKESDLLSSSYWPLHKQKQLQREKHRPHVGRKG